jgi:hypothetical protein
MRKLVLAALSALLMMSSLAQAAESCEAQAQARKLAGAARTSFMKKCEADAKAASPTAACEAQADQKKLAGAARTSFVKKCVQDAK